MGLLRLILFALVAYVAFLFVRVFFNLRRAVRPTGARAPRQVRGEMVKDEVCGTYIPRDEAVIDVRGGVERYFCSEECRRKLRAG